MKKMILATLMIIVAVGFANAQMNTTGYTSWKPLFNSMKTWDDGAFNMNQTGHPDYGWGVYNSITHGLSGDSIYLIKLQDGSLKQLFIEEKNSMANIYSFRFADVSGANEVVEQARCVDYTSKLFLYYSLKDKAFTDRDPMNTDWDMVLTKYTDTAINYTVTGFLLNEGTEVSVFHAPDASAASNSTLSDTSTFVPDLAVIGNSWNKVVGYSIVPLDTMVYFVKTPSKAIYKLQYTFFESGSASGSGKGRVGLKSQMLAPSVGSVVLDTLVMGNGYVNDVYYSMSLGITKTSPRASWDIAFKTNIYSASIIANTTMGVSLYTYPRSQGEGIDAWNALAVNTSVVKPALVYPNPVKDVVSFINSDWKDNSSVKMMVYNSAGMLVLSDTKNINGSTLKTSFNELAEGIYQARFLNNGSYSFAKVLIVR